MDGRNFIMESFIWLKLIGNETNRTPQHSSICPSLSFSIRASF